MGCCYLILLHPELSLTRDVAVACHPVLHHDRTDLSCAPEANPPLQARPGALLSSSLPWETPRELLLLCPQLWQGHLLSVTPPDCLHSMFFLASGEPGPLALLLSALSSHSAPQTSAALCGPVPNTGPSTAQTPTNYWLDSTEYI